MNSTKRSMISFQLHLDRLKGRSDFFEKPSAISSQLSETQPGG